MAISGSTMQERGFIIMIIMVVVLVIVVIVVTSVDTAIAAGVAMEESIFSTIAFAFNCARLVGPPIPRSAGMLRRGL